MGKKSDPPPAPDYTAAANAQADASKQVTQDQTWANRANQYTPFGNSTWAAGQAIDPGTGKPVTTWANTVSLNPRDQAALDAQQGISTARSSFANALLGNTQQDFAPGNQLDYSKLPGQASTLNPQTYDPGTLDSNLDSSSKYYKDANDAIYNQFADRAQPRFARESDDLRSRLYAQGLRDTDTAFKNQTSDLDQQHNDAYQQAQYQATIGSGQEASRALGMDQTAKNFGNNAITQQLQNNLGAGQATFQQNQGNAAYVNALRQQAIQEHSQQQNQNLNAMNALLTGQQIGNPQFQSYNTAGVSQTPQLLDAAKAQQSSAMDAYNAQQASANSMMSGIGQAAGVAAMFMSDRRLKRNIKPLGTWRGHKFYSFEYIWGEKAVGVMSDEVPGYAVFKHSSGFDMVNYGSL
jgi:hypothetical protein